MLALLLHLRLSRRLSFKDSVSGESLGFAPPSNEKQSKGLTEYMKRRNRLVLWNDWITDRNEVVDDADANGPVLDFVIAGFPKCGTTTMEANLSGLAPMPISDVCTPLPQTIWYAFRNWPNQFPDKDGGNTTKLLRGTKCPAAIHALKPYSRKLPRTLVIIGIRHPILWFQVRPENAYPNVETRVLTMSLLSPSSPFGTCRLKMIRINTDALLLTT